MESKDLLGVTTKSGWKLKEEREPVIRKSGGCHSLAYIAENDQGERAFVKVLDITVRPDVENPLAEIKDRIAKFEYELSLANQCKDAHLTMVVRAFEDDQIVIPGQTNPIFLLVFELADGDLREQSDLERRFDLAFRLRVLHRTAGGLRQLHWAQIAHQDLKPSNIVVFDNEKTKIADLGHAHQRANPRPGDDEIIAADATYAPPEQLYNAVPGGWSARRFAADIYLFGSVATFLFTGVGFTPMLACNLAKEHHWDNWCGSYEDVLPYLRVAFEAVIEELHNAAEPQVRDEIAQLVAYLCELDPLQRGHPLNLAGRGSEYGVERFESRFDYMASREELSLRRLIA